MLKTILAVIGLAIAGVLIFAATKPDTFRVERKARINAPPDKIFPLIDDFRSWTAWSPYENRDPNMQRTYGISMAGKGATYRWDGNSDVGAGHMEILESSPASKIVIKLDFEKPLEGHNTAEFTLVPVGDATEVTWAMFGPAPYISKLMGTFFNMDTMIGKDFETGLARLKTISEK